MSKINIFWLRRDLRTEDNRGFSEALKSGNNVLPIFIFDKEILDKLENKEDKRVDYFHQAMEEMHSEFKKHGSGIQTYHGKPLEIFKKIIKDFDVEKVFTNTDYEPYAKKRDEEVAKLLKKNSIDFQTFKDQLIFEKDDILKKDGTPYTVYTPYSRKWKEKFTDEDAKPCKLDFKNLYQFSAKNILSLKDLGFKETGFKYKKPVLKKSMIEDYDKTRNFPGEDTTTRIGVALRFGTISIRECVAFAKKNNEVWLNELIWREFFMQILYHFPKVVTKCFKEDYENIKWRNNEKEFKLWCEGKTGYPIVDAGMRQLNETGFMHNRVRMVTASFLTKHLLIDWRWGEAYFAEKLLDYELSSNNGNWQWAAGCGCDAAPYFRVFNPAEQSRKFDKNDQYVHKWQSKESKKMSPIVEHKEGRERALAAYREALKK